jgi:Protein of unknown function with HXXEE motif
MDFWPTNGFLIVIGISVAAVGWRAPGFALALPAALLINAVFFHLLPSITARRPNPGLFTAVVLYLPIGVWAYVAAGDEGVLDAGTVALSVVLGAAAMASVIVILALKKRFRYADV